MIYITPDFYSGFHCIADTCPNTCCAGWSIIIDRQTYAKILENEERFSIPAKEWLKEQDGEIVISMKEQFHWRCPMLNADNLCDIVLHTGEDYLSDTCALFPRIGLKYGNTIEAYLNLSCPEVISRLVEKEFLQFLYNEDEEPVSEYPYSKLYLFESSVRSCIINIIQNAPEISLTTRLFVSYKILEKAVQLYQDNHPDFNALKPNIDFYLQRSSLSSIETNLSGRLQNITYESNRYAFLQKIRNIIGFTANEHFAELVRQTNNYFHQNDLESYLLDLTSFRKSMKLYSTFYTNYWVYRTFIDLISIPDYALSKKKLFFIVVEFCLIQMIALSSYVAQSRLDKDEYILIISFVDRMVEHDETFRRNALTLLKESDFLNTASLMLMLLI